MISNELRELIEPYLKMHLHENDFKYIDGMFSEVYVTYEQHGHRVNLKPHPNAGTITMQFSPINGAFLEIHPDWEYIKQTGTKL